MRQKNITVAGLLFFLLLFPGTGEAAAFRLETVMNGARICGEGTIDFSSPERLSISFVFPREVNVTLQDDAARILRESIEGGRPEIYPGVTVTHMGKNPHTMRIDFPHETYMILTLEPEERAAGVHDGVLYDAAFTEKGRVLPFFLLVTKTRAAMFATSLLPLGWIDMDEGKPGEITRVIPDPDADIHLKRLAEVLAAGRRPGYKGQGWGFSCSPLGHFKAEMP